jgi:predicted methyltransferase
MQLDSKRRRWSGLRLPVASCTALLAVMTVLASAACSRAQNSGPERDRWNRPDEVIAALGIRPGSVVADVGCGKGYFALKFAARVAPDGKVYAEDIRDDVLDDLHAQARKQGLNAIETVLGGDNDPKLAAASLDVVFTMDSYHEWVDYDAMLDHLYAALKPGGLFGLIDGDTASGKSRDDYHSMHRMPEQMERDDLSRHGLRFLRSGPGFTRPSDGKTYYFLIFQKPGDGSLAH